MKTNQCLLIKVKVLIRKCSSYHIVSLAGRSLGKHSCTFILFSERRYFVVQITYHN